MIGIYDIGFRGDIVSGYAGWGTLQQECRM